MTRPAQPSVSVVLSFYNEEAVLPELIRRLRVVLREQREQRAISSYELVFVNDDSTDRSLEILERELAVGQDIVVVNMSRKFGGEECVLAGMNNALGDLVVYLDSDLQDPPEVIPKLLDAWRKDDEAEVVYTTRLSRSGEHPLKLFLTKWGYRLLRWIANIDLPVDSGDFKLLSRRAVRHLLKLEEHKPYVRGLVSWIGFKQLQVFYHREPRYDGRAKTKNPMWSRQVIYKFLDRAVISFSDAPLKAMLSIGFAVSLCSLAYISVVLVQKFLGLHVPGWPAIMAAILFLGGTQLVMLGVLGLYINIIFLEVKKRPNYIVKNVIAFDGRPHQSSSSSSSSIRP